MSFKKFSAAGIGWLLFLALVVGGQRIGGADGIMNPGANFNGLSLGAVRSLTSAKTSVIYGDSFMSNAGLSAAALPCGNFCANATSGSYAVWADIYSGYRVSRASPFAQSGTVTNCGVTGQTTAQILANISCPLAAKPDLVIYEGGTNDAAASIPCATVTANNRAIYSQLNAAGIIVIKVSVIPRSGGSAFTTAQANLAQCYNQFDRSYAQDVGSNGFYFVDLDPVVIDPAQASWSILANYLVDGVHPSNLGGSAMGYAIAQVINQLVPQWRQPIYTDGDVYDATNNPAGNLLPNGAFTGTGGTVTGTGCSGASAASVIVVCQTGLTAVSSIVKLSNGISGAQFVVSGSNVGTNQFDLIQQQVATPSNINVGDVVEAQGWVIFGPNTNVSLNLRLQTTESAANFNNDCGGINGGVIFPPAGFATGAPILLKTPRRTITAVPSAANVTFGIVYENSATVAATVTTFGWTLKKVLP